MFIYRCVSYILYYICPIGFPIYSLTSIPKWGLVCIFTHPYDSTFDPYSA